MVFNADIPNPKLSLGAWLPDGAATTEPADFLDWMIRWIEREVHCRVEYFVVHQLGEI